MYAGVVPVIIRLSSVAMTSTVARSSLTLSALIKCIGEMNAGNTEFRTAKESTGKSIRSMYQELPEVLDFVNEFLASYGSTLDELT